MSQGAYQGDVTPEEAWRALTSEPGGIMVDVRTQAEWTFVGLPDLSSTGRAICAVEWQSFPTMVINPDFVSEVEAKLAAGESGKNIAIYFICRSGTRSAHAASAMTSAGYKNCFNVAGGFEGRMDELGHRGGVDGWKADGLPWRQS